MTVDDYFERQTPEVKRRLKAMRSVIRKAVPRGEDVISYAIPAVRIPEGVVVFYAGWKKHLSLYPLSAAIRQTLEKPLAKYAHARGTVRFPLDEKLPLTLIARITRLRLKEVRTRASKGARAK